MKAMIWLQRLIAIGVGMFGFLTMFSETPIEQGILTQLWVTLGGAFILGLSVAWLFLISFEEERFINETR